jgi:hypothetical protein
LVYAESVRRNGSFDPKPTQPTTLYLTFGNPNKPPFNWGKVIVLIIFAVGIGISAWLWKTA